VGLFELNLAVDCRGKSLEILLFVDVALLGRFLLFVLRNQWTHLGLRLVVVFDRGWQLFLFNDFGGLEAIDKLADQHLVWQLYSAAEVLIVRRLLHVFALKKTSDFLLLLVHQESVIDDALFIADLAAALQRLRRGCGVFLLSHRFFLPRICNFWRCLFFFELVALAILSTRTFLVFIHVFVDALAGVFVFVLLAHIAIIAATQ